MKSILTIILLTITINCFSQSGHQNVYVCPYPFTAVFQKTSNDTNYYIFSFSQPHLDSLKTLYALTGTAQGTANGAKATADSARTINTQQATSLSTINNITLPAMQQQINNIVIPPTAGIGKPIIKTSSYTVSDTCYMRTIYMNCNGCTVTLPTCSPGLKFWVQAAGGTVTLVNSFCGSGWVSGSTKTMSINQRPVMVDYKTSQITNAR